MTLYLEIEQYFYFILSQLQDYGWYLVFLAIILYLSLPHVISYVKTKLQLLDNTKRKQIYDKDLRRIRQAQQEKLMKIPEILMEENKTPKYETTENANLRKISKKNHVDNDLNSSNDINRVNNAAKSSYSSKASTNPWA